MGSKVEKLSVLLFGASALGLVALAAQLVLVTWHRTRGRERRAPAPSRVRPISVLKPLAGNDDALDENLASFAALDHPSFEVVLGVKDAGDEAFGPALRAVMRWPSIFRLKLQQGQPGLNPKVNQLITLEAFR